MTTAYHFTADRLRDGRPIPPIGEWLEHEGEVEICKSGLHYSIHPFDALRYAPGNLLHLVEIDEIVSEQDDKGMCRRRKIVATINAEPLLREFARWCALQVLHLWDAPAIVCEYLETGDETKRAAARDAAWEAASEAARAAAWAVAWDAAWDVAKDVGRNVAWEAASEAARAAAWAVAWDVAWDAAWDVAKAAQRQEFKRRVEAVFEGKI